MEECTTIDQVTMDIYFAATAHEDYEVMTQKDKALMQRAHGHIVHCPYHASRYEQLKTDLERSGGLSQEDLTRLAANRKVLDALVCD